MVVGRGEAGGCWSGGAGGWRGVLVVGEDVCVR